MQVFEDKVGTVRVTHLVLIIMRWPYPLLSRLVLRKELHNKRVKCTSSALPILLALFLIQDKQKCFLFGRKSKAALHTMSTFKCVWRISILFKSPFEFLSLRFRWSNFAVKSDFQFCGTCMDWNIPSQLFLSINMMRQVQTCTRMCTHMLKNRLKEGVKGSF